MKLLYLMAIGVGTMSSSFLHAQWWTDAGLPIDGPNDVLNIEMDSTSNTLFVSGNLWDNIGQPDQAAHYCTYQDGVWSISVPFSHVVLTTIIYEDTLYAGGFFQSVDGLLAPYLARRVNGQWSSAGEFDEQVFRLKVLEGELYAVGNFTYADGNLCQGIAKRTGNSWQPIVPVGCEYCSLRDVAVYNGELYVTGNLTFQGAQYGDAMRLHQGSWIPVGEAGLYGGMSDGNTLEVYGGQLYLGGLFQLSDGNAGDAIMRWDGAAWSAVGTGVQDETGGYDQWIQVTDLQTHNGLLYVAGGFTYAGNEPANRIATWNGSEWCSVGGNFDETYVSAVGFYHDTLYAGCWYEADGQPVNNLAKFIAPAYEGNCSVPMAVSDMKPSRSVLEALGGRDYTLRGHSTTSLATLLDASGRITGSWAIHGEAPFQLPAVAAGVHVLFVQGSGAHRLLVLP